MLSVYNWFSWFSLRDKFDFLDFLEQHIYHIDLIWRVQYDWYPNSSA